MLPRLLASSLLLCSACATSQAQRKLSFAEVFGEEYATVKAPVPLSAGRPTPREVRRPKTATTSPELQAALVAFATRARSHRAAAARGSAMPLLQRQNWDQVCDALQQLLQRQPEETSSFDLIRARVTFEAELELDARAYGDFPRELAEHVLSLVTHVAVRMAEVRQLRVVTHDAPVAFSWPVHPVAVTSLYGRRLHPITRTYKLHFGLDLAAAEGQQVFAPAEGTVIRADWLGAHGLHIELQHAGGVVTRYSHLSEVLVEPGARVHKGEALGLAGNTGSSTGPHLHFEFWRDGKPKDPLEELGNPAPARPSVAAL